MAGGGSRRCDARRGKQHQQPDQSGDPTTSCGMKNDSTAAAKRWGGVAANTRRITFDFCSRVFLFQKRDGMGQVKACTTNMHGSRKRPQEYGDRVPQFLVLLKV